MDGFDPDGDDLSWSAAGLPPGFCPRPGHAGRSPGCWASPPPAPTRSPCGRPTTGPRRSAGQVAFSWEVSDTNRAPVVVVPVRSHRPRRAPRWRWQWPAPIRTATPSPGRPTGLPPGLAIDPATGVISGTLGFGAADGSPYRVTVAAADDGSPGLMAGGSFTWSIGDVDRAPVLGSLPDRYGEVGDGVAIAPDRLRRRRRPALLVGLGPAAGRLAGLLHRAPRRVAARAPGPSR